MEGQPTRIIIDSYNVISKIIKRPDQVKKILKKFSVLDDPNLPDNEKDLEKYLSNSLRESTSELTIDPPFSSYMGDNPYLFAITDPRKIRPLVLGKSNGMYCLTSETRVFKKINFEYVKDIPGGSIIIIDKNGNIFEKQVIKKQYCLS